jgi:hypothetical protein
MRASTKRRTVWVAAISATCAMASGYAAAGQPDQTVTPYQVVTHDNQKDWKIDAVGGAVTFEPATTCDAPSARGAGAVRLTVAPGDGYARLRNGRYNNTPLASLVALDYWTCDNNNNGQQWPFLMLNVDWNGDHQADDIIFFEPSYQNPSEGGACGALSGQATPALHTWQHWDALRGSDGTTANACWWSANDATFMPGDVIRSLSQYVLQHPGAAIVNPSGNRGGVQIVHGFASPSDNFDGYADSFRIADNNPNSGVTYDFEPAQ